MRISVLGIGYVGAVSAACLAGDGHIVTAVDINPGKVNALNEGRTPICEGGLDDLLEANVTAGRLSATTDIEKATLNAELSCVCVGTPSMVDGALDIDDVVRVCDALGRVLRHQSIFHVVVLRSTVLPGSTSEILIPALERASGKRAGRDFGVAFYPEFMREGSALSDYRDPGIIVFGTEDQRSEATLRRLVKSIRGDLHVTSYSVAETIKYVCNAWHATKITFANEIGNFCKSVGVDSHRVMDVFCDDKRLNISSAYLRPGFAYGGSCLPKDLRALHHRARTKGLALPMLESLAVSNAAQVRRAFDMVRAAGHRRVGMLGLSFKRGTDDLRESPAVELAALIHSEGYQLNIFDPNVDLSKLMGSNLSYIQARLPHLDQWLTKDLARVITFGDTLVVATHDLGSGGLPKLRPDQVLIDLVRADLGKSVPNDYRGLCW